MIDFSFLDTIWKSLFLFSFSITAFFSISLLLFKLLKQSVSSYKAKWFFNLHAVIVVISIFISILILSFSDQELIVGCFNHFASLSSSYPITRLIAGTYLAILSILAVMDIIGIIFSYSKHSKMIKIKNHTINKRVDELKNKLNIHYPIQVLLNTETHSPYVWGLFSHSIVVNSDFLNLDENEESQAILSHELMHIKSYDSVWLLFNHFCKRALFFNPLSYIFYKKHRLTVEMAADEKTVEQLKINSKTLIDAIINMAESCKNSREHFMQLKASAEFNELKERIQSLATVKIKNRPWLFPIFSSLSIMLSTTILFIQTQSAIAFPGKHVSKDTLMCSQVAHEIAIEKWLSIETATNRCEIK